MEMYNTDDNALVAHSERTYSSFLMPLQGHASSLALTSVRRHKSSTSHHPTEVLQFHTKDFADSIGLENVDHFPTNSPPKRTLVMKFTTISGVLVRHPQD